MVEKLYPSEIIEKHERDEEMVEYFDGRVRYLASSLIITIPIRIVRRLDIKLGDKLEVVVKKKTGI